MLRTSFVSLVLLAAVIASAASAAGTNEVSVSRFYCGSLSDAGEATRLDYFRLGQSLDEASWAGIVRAPILTQRPSAQPWCLDMSTQDVAPERCRGDGPPRLGGALEFEVRETLIGDPFQRIAVAPKSNTRLLFGGEFTHPEHPKVACTQTYATADIEGKAYFSPPTITLDPKRDYVLVVRPSSDDASPGPWVAVFGIVDHPDAVRRDLRKAAKERRKAVPS
jgi:hypothetical protein